MNSDEELILCKGNRADMFKKDFPLFSIQLTHAGTLWWEGFMTKGHILSMRAAGFACQPVHGEEI